MTAHWLTFLEPYTIDDTLRAEAYENATAEQRQLLKTAIAYQALQGECPSAQSQFYEHKNKGFWQRKHSAPAPLLFILCGEEYLSPARLIATTMPALLAGVNQCIFIQIGKPKPALLTALELLGIEEAYALPHVSDAMQWLRTLHNDVMHSHNQRLLLLHQEQSLQSLHPMIMDLHMPFFEDARAPHIFLPPTIDESMKSNIHYTQPDAVMVLSPFDFAHAYYGMEKPSLNVLSQAISQGTARYDQHLTQGMEGCWHISGLCPQFFLNQCVMAGTAFDAEPQ